MASFGTAETPASSTNLTRSAKPQDPSSRGKFSGQGNLANQGSRPALRAGPGDLAYNRGTASPGSFANTLFIQGPASFRWDYYFDQIGQALSSGHGVIVLVPDIRKLDIVVHALESRFGPVSIVHSDLTGATRRENWLRLLQGKSTIAVGSRSAVLSPVKNLGLIVVDEEESHLYKAEEFPRYNAATVARIRANLQDCKALLGSFVPSIRTRYYMSQGKLGTACIATPGDVPDSPGASVTHMVISMLGTKRGMAISKQLHLALRDIFNDGERAVLFLNRRGTAPALVCSDCGSTIMCPRCSVALAYHARDKVMVCHTCGYSQPLL